MQTNIFIILLILLVGVGCSGNAEKPGKQEEIVLAEENYKPVPAERFLRLFDDLSSDTIKVFSQYNDKRTHFIGEPIRKEFYPFLMDAYDKEYATLYMRLEEGQIAGNPDFSAIYKFRIAKGKLGLLVRTPSDYEASSIKLFIWDEAKLKTTHLVELSEIWGDAGDTYQATSLLITKPDFKIVKYSNTTWAEDEEFIKFTSYDSLFHYQIQPDQIKLLTRQRADLKRVKELGLILN